MILIVDSWAWLKLLDGKDTEHYGKCIHYLEDKNNELYTNVLNLYEVFYRAAERIGQTQAHEFIASIKDSAKIVLVGETLALNAAAIHQREKLPAIDAFVYATAVQLNGKVLTGDPDFKGKERAIFIG